MAALRNSCKSCLLSTDISLLMAQVKTNNTAILVSVNRYFSTSKPIQGRGITEKGKRKAKAQHDAKLRQAIDLYHSSQYFYPTRPTITGQTKSGLLKAEDLQEYREEGTEVRSLDEEIDWIIRADLFLQRKKDDREHLYDRQNGPISMRNASMLLDHVERERTSQESSEQSSIAELVSGNFSSTIRTEANMRNGSEPLPDPKDQDAIKVYIANAIRRASLASRNQNEGAAAAPHHSGHDLRKLRIRDALFGTVQGRLPGLEIVRERSRDPRVQEEANRLLKEAKERLHSQKQSAPESSTEAGSSI